MAIGSRSAGPDVPCARRLVVMSGGASVASAGRGAAGAFC